MKNKEVKIKCLDFLGFPRHFLHSDGSIYNSQGKKLKPYIMKTGYHKYILRYNYNELQVFMHQIVAKVFVPNPNPEVLDNVDHIDNNKENNDYTNLQWMTREANVTKSWDEGLHDHQRKITIKLDIDGNIIEKYKSIAKAAESVGVKPSTISRAADSGRLCAGFYWEKKEEGYYK